MDRNIAEPIASTRFIYNGEEVLAKIYRPVLKWDDRTEYSCQFSVDGADLYYSNDAIGIDSMQSIILALAKIGDYILNNDEIEIEKIDWPGGILKFPGF